MENIWTLDSERVLMLNTDEALATVCDTEDRRKDSPRSNEKANC